MDCGLFSITDNGRWTEDFFLIDQQSKKIFSQCVMSFKSFKNISNFRTHSIYLSGLKFEGYSGYNNSDPNYFIGKTPLKSGYSSIFTNLTTSTNGTYIVVVGDSFAIQWTGYFLCNETGTWTFSNSSDDNSYLWLGDTAKTGNFTKANCLIDNSGDHSMQTVTRTINLVTDTIYPIRIQFGESAGGNDINVYFIKPSGGTTKIYDGTGYYFNNSISI